MKENVEQIKKALRSGDYAIEHEEDCNCQFRWGITNGELVDDVDGHECWEGNILYVAGDYRPIAQHIRYEGTEALGDLSLQDIRDIDEAILDKMSMSDMVERGESPNNDTHELRRREALVEYLMEGELILDEDPGRGFANEYTMILRELGEGEDIQEATKAEAQDWADKFLYSGDASTESFVSFRYEE